MKEKELRIIFQTINREEALFIHPEFENPEAHIEFEALY